jgi:hypothetical protein
MFGSRAYKAQFATVTGARQKWFTDLVETFRARARWTANRRSRS